MSAVQQQAALSAELRSGLLLHEALGGGAKKERKNQRKKEMECIASQYTLERATLSLNMLCYAELILESSTLV